jgi:hypothetical protein
MLHTSNAHLRVRTSGSTSPSPISSPSLVGAQAAYKARANSMDRVDSFSSRLMSASVQEEAAVDAAEEPTAGAKDESAAAPPHSGKRSQEHTLLLRLDQRP